MSAVTITCEWCGIAREVAFEHRHRRFCAKPATCCYDYLKRPKPQLTEEQRQANEMLRRQRSGEARRGRVTSPEVRAKISASLKASYADGTTTPSQFVRSEAWKASVSSGLRKAYREGRANATAHCRGKWSWYEGPLGRIHMRSQSEVIFAEKLDLYDIEWQYEPKRFDLGWTTYCPDFYLPAPHDLWVEVKGWLTDQAVLKMSSFREMGYRLVMTTYQEVRATGLPFSTEEVDLHVGR